VSGEPGFDWRCFVGGVIVEHQVGSDTLAVHAPTYSVNF
jgi:hypothetical protein